ncbi:hypothetical protein [Sphingomonas quercus]|uniref:Uncharacterized protein n=1 Tax=Sphingomonas quercus TaxID=2842451 RepID=A0ABS6BFX0_9SPHN|nr:hypothetical protein [Sphingomonas quercus]MBU3077183.1 hypothetical protein [Sphingomonas quercus]
MRGLILCAVLLSTATQAADTRWSAVATAGAGYSRNPFSTSGANYRGGSGFYSAAIAPTFDILTERTNVSLTGHASLQDYFKSYRESNSYGAGATITNQTTERLSLNARLSYDSSVIGSSVADIIDTPIDEPVDAGQDVGLFGTSDRRQTYGANAGFAYALSARDSINGSGFYTASRYHTLGNLGNYDSYGGSLAYQRQVSARVKLGLQGSASYNDYQRSEASLGGGLTKVYSPQATFDVQLSEIWTLNGAVGASFIKRGGDLSGSGTSTTFSGSITLCRRGQRHQECLNASRQVRPTGFAGTQNQTQIGLTSNYSLSERTRLNGSVSYTDLGGRGLGLAGGVIDRVFATNVGLSHQLTERLSVTSGAFYRRFAGSSTNVRSDLGGRLGLSYTLGDRR